MSDDPMKGEIVDSRGQAIEDAVNAEIDRREVAKIVACRIQNTAIEIKPAEYRALWRHLHRRSHLHRRRQLDDTLATGHIMYRGYKVQPSESMEYNGRSHPAIRHLEPGETVKQILTPAELREKFITDMAILWQVPRSFVEDVAGATYDALQEYKKGQAPK